MLLPSPAGRGDALRGEGADSRADAPKGASPNTRKRRRKKKRANTKSSRDAHQHRKRLPPPSRKREWTTNIGSSRLVSSERFCNTLGALGLRAPRSGERPREWERHQNNTRSAFRKVTESSEGYGASRGEPAFYLRAIMTASKSVSPMTEGH